MAEITASMVKDLRERTGAGMSDCKKALQECDGDSEKATEYLRKKGLATAAKKAGRIAAEGLVSSYVHMNGRIGVLLEVNSETDFVARGDEFQKFVHEVAMQIAAMNPPYVTEDEIPADLIEKERAIHTEKVAAEGKPEPVRAKIVDGQIAKWKKDVCLIDQPWMRDGTKTIGDLLKELIARIGENCKIRRFVRYELGEGIEKRKEDFAAEVAKQLAQ